MEFRAVHCTVCLHTIRGCSFSCAAGCQVDTKRVKHPGIISKTAHVTLCEDCARKNLHPVSHLIKRTKYSALSQGIGDLNARELCTCDQAEQASVHFPFTRQSREAHATTCSLRQLVKQHTKVRYDDLMTSKGLFQSQDSRPSGNDTKISFWDRLAERNSAKTKHSRNESVPKNSFSKTLVKAFAGPAARIAASQVKYGNVHMALSMGTIVIENGTPE